MVKYYHFNKHGDYLGLVPKEPFDKLMDLPQGEILIYSHSLVMGMRRGMWVRSSSKEKDFAFPPIGFHEMSKMAEGKIKSMLMVLGEQS